MTTYTLEYFDDGWWPSGKWVLLYLTRDGEPFGSVDVVLDQLSYMTAVRSMGKGKTAGRWQIVAALAAIGARHIDQEIQQAGGLGIEPPGHFTFHADYGHTTRVAKDEKNLPAISDAGGIVRTWDV